MCEESITPPPMPTNTDKRADDGSPLEARVGGLLAGPPGEQPVTTKAAGVPGELLRGGGRAGQ